MFNHLDEKVQKHWVDGKCYVKFTDYVHPGSSDNFGDGVPELKIEWKEIPLNVDPGPPCNSNTRMYIGKYASEYWQDTGELIYSETKR